MTSLIFLSLLLFLQASFATQAGSGNPNFLVQTNKEYLKGDIALLHSFTKSVEEISSWESRESYKSKIQSVIDDEYNNTSIRIKMIDLGLFEVLSPNGLFLLRNSIQFGRNLEKINTMQRNGLEYANGVVWLLDENEVPENLGCENKHRSCEEYKNLELTKRLLGIRNLGLFPDIVCSFYHRNCNNVWSVFDMTGFALFNISKADSSLIPKFAREYLLFIQALHRNGLIYDKLLDSDSVLFKEVAGEYIFKVKKCCFDVYACSGLRLIEEDLISQDFTRLLTFLRKHDDLKDQRLKDFIDFCLEHKSIEKALEHEFIKIATQRHFCHTSLCLNILINFIQP